jgi:hypothetical protein
MLPAQEAWPQASSAGVKQLLDAYRVHPGARVRVSPGRVAATSLVTAEVEKVLDVSVVFTMYMLVRRWL